MKLIRLFLTTTMICSSSFAFSNNSLPQIISNDNTTAKEVYNFKSKEGTPVFTDMKPENNKYQTQTIITAKPQHITRQSITLTKSPKVINNTQINHNTTIIQQYRSGSINKKRTKLGKSNCNYLMRRLEWVNNKMKGGYKVSEYQRLEKERVKYRRLIFEKCNSRVN